MFKRVPYQVKAIFDNRADVLIRDPKDVTYYGLTLLEIAQYLDRKDCIKVFTKEKKDKAFKDFIWIDHLIFSTPKLFKKVLKRCDKAKKEYDIDEKKIWKGAYYQKEIEEKISPKVKIKKVDNEVGYGVFANQEIKPFAFVGEYVGVVKKKMSFFKKNNHYCMRYPSRFLGKKEYVIDSKEMGNFTRFINHSDKPNLELESVYLKPLTHMLFFAKRKIEKGEQLTFDYGKTYWKEIGQTPKRF